nr:hypothetical protein [Streptomyces sp. WM4235]
MAITSPDGTRRAFFGPVLDATPARADAIRLWEATLLMAGVSTFRELKA